MAVKDYQAALAFIHGRTKFKKSPQLDRMRLFAAELGNPERKFKSIHVTGTNGKGSTVAFLRELFLKQGLHVGTYTSPFIIRFNDRITFDGQMISDQELIELVNQVQPVVAKLDQRLKNQGGGPTEFEIITAIMFLYFAQKQPDVAIIEVGIGGKYDSTNIISPMVSVITTVAHDHAKLLGTTLAQIAEHKAGIIKSDCPVVLGKIPPAALQVILQKARQEKAPVYQLGTEFEVAAKAAADWGEIINYRGQNEYLKNLPLALLGSFQPANAAVALTAFLLAAKQLKLKWQLSAISAALGNTSWPGRFEPVNSQPLVILDGAHNLAAFQELRQTLQTYFKGTKVFAIAAILADKQPEAMINELLKIPQLELTLTEFNAPRNLAEEQQLAKRSRVSYQADWQQALVQNVQQMSADDLLLFCGSLYFISDVRHYFVD